MTTFLKHIKQARSLTCVRPPELTAQDCLYMGKHAFNLGHYGQSVEWFSEAYSLAGHERNHTVTQTQVAEFLNTALVAVSG